MAAKTQMMHQGKLYYSVAAAAKLLGISRPKLKQLIGPEGIEYCNVRANGAIWVSSQDINSYLRRREYQAANSKSGSANSGETILSRRLLVVAMAFLGCSWASAQGIHRRVEKGKTVFSDKPCADSAKPEENAVIEKGARQQAAPVEMSDSGYKSIYGDWRGPTQFHGRAKGQPIPDAHAVVPLTIKIDPQGKLVGASAENGCRLLGLASPGAAPTVMTLDVTLTGCQFKAFNRRYSGSFSLYSAAKHTQLNLISISNLAGEMFDIKATLRR